MALAGDISSGVENIFRADGKSSAIAAELRVFESRKRKILAATTGAREELCVGRVGRTEYVPRGVGEEEVSRESLASGVDYRSSLLC